MIYEEILQMIAKILYEDAGNVLEKYDCLVIAEDIVDALEEKELLR